MRILKIAVYAVGLVLVIAAATVFVVWEYGTPVSRGGIDQLKVTTRSSGHPTTVSVDGSLISSALAVTSVKQHREGRCIVVVVRQAVVRQGRRSADFHLDIAVPDEIDQIAFANSRDVIWHR